MTELAIYIVMRRDLMMPRGKEIAQACHAVIALRGVIGIAIIGVRAESEEHLHAVVDAAKAVGVRTAIVTDAGRTVFNEPTVTCAAIGPVEKGRVAALADCKLY